MKHILFTRPNCPECPKGYNRGNEIEWRIAYDMTGVPGRANNYHGADIGTWQVKSPKASVSDETESTGFIFGFYADNGYYMMSKTEFESFLQRFSYMDKDSKTGKSKVRIKNDTKTMRAWFEERT